ncbi:hypothetical protein SA2016_0948 [Sinomonas atrocyanea]|uniref:Uncharacterized protein n=1 Tax=Sinomonas atrocyanea TaxID=37927 RepID=A0A126ZX07_9MICC|nr:hypothetical protein SA2016_0948 [Sinomonas atrocyanea]
MLRVSPAGNQGCGRRDPKPWQRPAELNAVRAPAAKSASHHASPVECGSANVSGSSATSALNASRASPSAKSRSPRASSTWTASTASSRINCGLSTEEPLFAGMRSLSQRCGTCGQPPSWFRPGMTKSGGPAEPQGPFGERSQGASPPGPGTGSGGRDGPGSGPLSPPNATLLPVSNDPRRPVRARARASSLDWCASSLAVWHGTPGSPQDGPRGSAAPMRPVRSSFPSLRSQLRRWLRPSPKRAERSPRR